MGKRGPKIDPEFIARVVVDATLLGDGTAAKRHNVSTKTVQRYREMAQSDANVSKLVSALWAAADKDWGKGLASALRGQIEFLNRATEKADPSNPEAITAVTGALETLADVALTKRMLDARLGPEAGAEAGGDRQHREGDSGSGSSVH